MPREIVNGVLASTITAVVLLLGGAFGNWATGGGLLSLLGGVTRAELQGCPEIQTGNLDVVGNVGALMDEGDEWRTYQGTVTFDTAFSRRPIVTLAVNRLDVAESQTRIILEVVRISTTGFDYRAGTWDKSRVLRVGASWTAVLPPVQDSPAGGDPS